MEQEQILNLDNEIKHPWTSWEEQEYNSFIYQVQSGRQGGNAGLNNGLQRINRYIYGTQKGRYYLIGADSSVGKTTLADFMFVLSTWADAKAKNIPIKIYYCSFEMARIDKVARWVSFYIFQKTGKCIPSEYILGRIHGNTVSEEDLALIIEAYNVVNEMMKDIILIDGAVHPTKIFEDIIEHHYEKEGKVVRQAVNAADAKKGKKGRVMRYIPNDPKAITLLVIDHLGLLSEEMGLNTKGVIDKMSRYGIVLRNLFQTTCVFIQQFSTDLLQTKRQQLLQLSGGKKASAIIPTRLDFGDSKATYRDAEVVIGLVKPYLFDIEDFWGINTGKTSSGGLGDYMIAGCLMKNRYGAANKITPLFLNPIAGVAYDLPDSLDEDVLIPWYSKAKELDKVVQQYNPKSYG